MAGSTPKVPIMNKKDLNAQAEALKSSEDQPKRTIKQSMNELEKAAETTKGERVLDAMSNILNMAKAIKEKALKYNEGAALSDMEE